MEKILVTGANGMLATNIIEQLLSRGYDVVGMLRRSSSYKGPRHERLILHEGDFKDRAAFAEAVRGCTGVFHVAAMTRQSGSFSQFDEVNHLPVPAMLEESAKAGVHRFLYVSTANTIGCGTRENPADETTPWSGPLTQSFYARTKEAAERCVLGFTGDMETVVVNPTFMIGRYGSRKGSNTMLALAGTVSFCPKGGKNFIDVEEAARGMILAYERGRNGQKYLICGDNYSFRQFYRLFPQVRCTPEIPRWFMHAAGALGQLLHRLGIPVAFTRANMGILMSEDAYHGRKAEIELGFRPAPLDPVKLNSYR